MWSGGRRAWPAQLYAGAFLMTGGSSRLDYGHEPDPPLAAFNVDGAGLPYCSYEEFWPCSNGNSVISGPTHVTDGIVESVGDNT